jgi:hypothetical protein
MLCLLPATGQALEVVYSQPNDSPNGEFSDAVPGQYNSIQRADNFELAGSACSLIVGVRWWGGSEGYEYLHLDNFEAWLVAIYEDLGGMPGDLLYEEMFPKAATDPIATGNTNMLGGYEYEQYVWLTTPVQLSVSTPYWIVIGADADVPDGDGWIWSRNYFQGDEDSAADQFDDFGWRDQTGDWAFELVGTCCSVIGDAGKYCWADIYPNNDDGVWDAADGDCTIGLYDLAELMGGYGTTPDATREDGDIFPLGGDGTVDLLDLAELMGQYGDDCDP